MSEQKKALSEEEAAAYLGMAPGTLANKRLQGRVEIPYFRTGDGPRSPVRYRQKDLDAWIEARLVKR
jgi:predicted DNA-binding transcriptional regulator AlpA